MMYRVFLNRSKRALKRAPVSEPTAIKVPSNPYEAGPFPNSFVAISALKIWKLSPNVAAKKTSAITTYKSGRAMAYRMPSRIVPSVSSFLWMKKSFSRIATRAAITNR